MNCGNLQFTVKEKRLTTCFVSTDPFLGHTHEQFFVLNVGRVYAGCSIGQSSFSGDLPGGWRPREALIRDIISQSSFSEM